MNHNQTTEWFIGRAKTILVFGQDSDAQAVISTVVAQVCDDELENHICFTGPVKFSSKAIKHITEIILPIVDQILIAMSVPPKKFILSVVNLEASSIMDTGSNISGFSADVPIFLAIISAGLKIPITDHIVSTGHVASSGGDIRMVMALPEKLTAAAKDDLIHTFIHPALDQDNSLETLSPNEKEKIADALAQIKTKLHIVPVRTIDDLVRVVFENEQIVLASLKQRFYEVASHVGKPVSHTVAGFFIENNEKNFWNVLERNLFASQINKAKELLQAFSQFHIHQKVYPKQFGKKLRQLILSMPPGIRQKLTIPIIPVPDCLKISLLANDHQHEDVLILFKAVSGEKSKSLHHTRHEKQVDAAPDKKDSNPVLEKIIEDISADKLTKLIGLPIDSARAVFQLETVVVDSSEELNETITTFFIHLLRHTNTIIDPIEKDMAGTEALALTERAFSQKGRYEAALEEAKNATNGGMHFILNIITDQYKQEQYHKHISYILKSALDPLDWNTKVDLIKSLMNRLKHHLPKEITSQPAERYASHYEGIIEAYVQSTDRFKTIIRSY